MADSTRTKRIAGAEVDEDMPMLKRAVRAAALGASKLADKVGFTQEDQYKGKSKEELQKKAKGGKVKKYAFGGDVSGQPMSAFGSQNALGTQQQPVINVQSAPNQPQGNPNMPGLMGIKAAGFKKGGKVKKLAVGGSNYKTGQPLKDAKTVGQPMKFKKGGSIDGCAQRGKTKGRMV